MKFKTSIAVAVTFASLLTGARADITTGLALYLPLNETTGSTVNDSSGNGNNGTIVNFTGDAQWTNAWISGGLTLTTPPNPTNYVSIPDAASLNFTNQLQFTVATWVKMPFAQIGGGAIIAKGTGGGGEQYDLDINQSQFRLVARNSGGMATTVQSLGTRTANVWQHVAAVYDGVSATKTLRMYVNGVSNNTTTSANLATLRFSANPVTIGARQSAAAAYNLIVTNVTVDEVRLYSRALSASDVYELYANNGKRAAISTQPRSVTNYVGDYAAFNVAVDNNNSTLPIGSYQWQWYGTNLPGATNTSLVITNVQLANVGPYSVTVSNIIGPTNSAIAFLQVQTLPAANITNNLVGYWQFDDASGSTTATDATVNASSAALTFNDYTSCWVTGLISGALNFNADGTAGNLAAIPGVGTPAPAVLDFAANPAFTLAAWVKGAPTQTNGAAVIAKGNGGGGEQYVMDINAGAYRFYVRNSNGAVSTVQTAIAPNNTWQHLAAVFDAVNGNMNFYVNGQLTFITVAPLSLLTNAHEVSIGNRQAGAAAYGDPFTGAIDDVRIYSRALTSADIQALYLAGGVYPPSVDVQPQGAALYAGDNLKFSPVVSGTLPITYQWKTNGVGIPGATNSTLSLTNLQLADAAAYTLAATNTYGFAISSNAVVQVSPFDLTNALAGHWKFDETTGLTAADSSTNGNNASLVSFAGDDSQWVTGRVSGAMNINPAGISLQHAAVPDSASLNFNGNLRFSLAAWVRGPASQISGAGIIAKGIGSLDEEYALDTHTDLLATPGYRFYVRNSSGTSVVLPTPVAPNGTWQHIVATYDGGFNLMNFYVNGQLVASNYAAPSSLLLNTHEVTIGAREQNSGSGYNWYFSGTVDDVRMYSRALSASDVQTLFATAGAVPPVFYTQPQSASKWVGESVTFSALVDGTLPLSYQWLKDGTNLVGATSSSLTLTNLQLTDAGTYNLQVTNIYPGPAILSSNAVLQVTQFTITNTVAHWRFDETSGTTAADSSGYGNTGALNNFPLDDSQWTTGRIAGGLNCNTDGTLDDVVIIPDGAKLNFTNAPAFSLAAWVRSKGTQIQSAAIIAKGTGAGGEQYCIDVQNGVYRVFVRSSTGTAPGVVTTNVPNGRWQHIVATLDSATGLIVFYVNGQLVGSNIGGAPAALLYTTHEVSIGSRQSGSGAYDLRFQGVVDDVRIYNKALSASEVQQLYDLASPLGPVIYAQPQSATRYAHDGVTFSVQADGTGALGYQWRKTENDITGATNASLTLANLQFSDAANYSVRVTDTNSSLLSSNAALTVLAVPPPDITNLLVAYWTFNETNGSSAADSSGNNNSASLFDFTTDDSQWVPGVLGGALHFGGAGPANRVATDVALNGLQNGNQFTFSFWAKRDPGPSGTNPRFFAPVAGQHWVVWSPGKGVGFFTPANSTEPSSNNWHHFVVLFDRLAGAYSLYVDGARQVTEAAGYAKTDPSALQWFIGHSESATATTDTWTGLLDDARIYNRLLTLNDAQALYFMFGQPQLSVVRSGGSITLSWPRGADGFKLHTADAPTATGAAWTLVTDTPVVSADGVSQTVTLGATDAARFYRLQKP